MILKISIKVNQINQFLVAIIASPILIFTKELIFKLMRIATNFTAKKGGCVLADTAYLIGPGPCFGVSGSSAKRQ